jgi:hypothetical protein
MHGWMDVLYVWTSGRMDYIIRTICKGIVNGFIKLYKLM